jgi:hypothetical protein
MGAVVAAAVDPPAATVGDAGELLDIDVDELAGPFPLITTSPLGVGRPVTAIQPGESGLAQDRLHGRRSQAGLVSDVISTPPALLAHLDDPPPTGARRPVG